MLCFLTGFTLHVLAFSSFATPYHFTTLRPRSNSSAASLSPGIEATITSPTGDDVTSNFQILLYKSPKETTSNLTDRNIASMRALNFCWSPRQTFYYSHCDYNKHHLQGGLLRQYTIYCRNNLLNPNNPYSRIISQPGACATDEICVDGAGGLDRTSRDTVAKCVSRSFFKPILREHTPDEERNFMTDLRAMTAVTVLTKTDGTTPLNVNRLELDSGVVAEEGDGDGDGKGVVQSNQTCTDCFTLATSKFQDGTDFLRTQATLSSVGVAAAAGIMYLAVLSSG